MTNTATLNTSKKIFFFLMWQSKIRLKNKREIQKGKPWWRKVNQTLTKERKKKIGKGKASLFEEVSFGGFCTLY